MRPISPRVPSLSSSRTRSRTWPTSSRVPRRAGRSSASANTSIGRSASSIRCAEPTQAWSGASIRFIEGVPDERIVVYKSPEVVMRMEGQDESENVEDARASGGFRSIHGIGLGTIALALIGGWVFGVIPLQLLGLMSGGGTAVSTAPDQSLSAPPAGDAEAHFVSQILRS